MNLISVLRPANAIARFYCNAHDNVKMSCQNGAEKSPSKCVFKSYSVLRRREVKAEAKGKRRKDLM